MRFVAMTDRSGATLEVVFGGQNESRPTEMVDVDEFIGIKSHRAKGKRITTYEVATLSFITPEEPEAEEAEDVDYDNEMDNELDADLDNDAVEAVEPKAEPRTKSESDEEFTPSQLDLF